MSSLQPQLKTSVNPTYRLALTSQKIISSGKISEAIYWSEYYEKQYDESGNPVSYEWNNGYLEVKPVPDYLTYLIHDWFLNLLRQYLQHHGGAKYISLETGGKFTASKSESVIRKPDLGVVLDSNPIPLSDDNRRYKGLFDMCIETLSTSRRSEIERDTVQKKREYQAAGVQEYLILAREEQYCQYYQLNRQGVYEPAPRDQDGLVRSRILSGFQWRMQDLYSQPDELEMVNNPVYQNFVSLAYQREKQARLEAEQQIAELKALLAKFTKTS